MPNIPPIPHKNNQYIYIYRERERQRERERERKRDNIIIIKSLFNVGYIIAHTEKFTLIA